MAWITIALVLVGILIGPALAYEREFFGVVFGGLIGYLLGAQISLRRQLRELKLSKTIPAAESSKPAAQVATPISPVTPASQPEPTPVPQAAPARSEQVESRQEAAYTARQTTAYDLSQSPVAQYIRNFFTDGNAVVRIGLLVLFFGVAFLIKYVSEHSLVPIELRLAGVFLAAVAMLYIGRRVARKQQRRTYGLLIMGGAIGMMYLTVFAAARLYEVIPLGMAMLVLIGLTIFGNLLAILENAKGLAILSVAGAFLAPILTSTNSGNHVALFSYYALINLGIVVIAWFKAWRELNLEGYLFTFVIGGLWGYQSYTPEHFASTEPFLILFFVMFVLISVLFAHRRAPSFKDYVDSTLVFGVPLASFVLQSFMVMDTEYGMALSALAVAVFYVFTAFILWRRQQENLRLLTESFLSLGVAFATLAIPFAVDPEVTAAAWALEGAGILWVGTRQRKTLQWGSGLLLQLAAAWFFFDSHSSSYYDSIAFLNATYLGSLLIAVAGLFSAYNLDRHRQELRMAEFNLPLVMLIWGLLWLYTGGLQEIDNHYELWLFSKGTAALLFLSIITLILHGLCRRLDWMLGGRAVHGFVFLMLIAGLFLPFVDYDMPLSDHLGFIVFPLAYACYYVILKQREQAMASWMRALWHMFGLWWLFITLTYELVWRLNHHLDISSLWGAVLWGVLPPVVTLVVMRISRGNSWPIAIHRELYLTKVISPMMLFSWYWVIQSSEYAGSSTPLPFITLLNPLELATLFILIVGLYWIIRMHRDGLAKGIFLSRRNLTVALGITAFIWLNAVIGRAVHHYAGIPHYFDELFASLIFQMSVSVVWSLLALAMTFTAHRLHERALWITGMGLLVLVVLKLFFIDLANSGTIERIISFITVGVLMLVVGYVAPLPPAKKDVSV